MTRQLLENASRKLGNLLASEWVHGGFMRAKCIDCEAEFSEHIVTMLHRPDCRWVRKVAWLRAEIEKLKQGERE